MLTTGIIYPIDQSEWASPMVVQPKNNDPTKLRICVNFRELNKVTLTYPFPTPYVDGNLNEIIGHECYSFMDGFSGYNQVPIAKEDQKKTTFVCEFGSFSYKVMPFGLKNAPAVFLRIVVKRFQEYIYKTMAVYFDNWMIYSMLKDHYKWLRLMLEHCRQIQLSLNIKKFIFLTPIGILLGHIVCKEGIKVDFAKIKIILDLKPPVNPKQFRVLLGYTRNL